MPLKMNRRTALGSAAGTALAALVAACGTSTEEQGAAQQQQQQQPATPIRAGGTVGLGIVGLHVTDLERSLAFYRRIGLDIPTSINTSEGVFRLRLPTGQIFFWETVEYTQRYFEDYERGTGQRRVSIEFGFADPASVDAMHRDLTEGGADSYFEPMSFGRTRLAGVVDPDGNQINLRFPLAS